MRSIIEHQDRPQQRARTTPPMNVFLFRRWIHFAIMLQLEVNGIEVQIFLKGRLH